MNVGQAGKLSDKRYDKEFDNVASLEEARRRLPLKQMMQEHGLAPEGGRWKGFKCPFCQKKGKASVFKGNDAGDLFKCFSSSCPSGTGQDGKAFDEVGFLAYVSNLNRKDAFVAYLKQTGVWKEREKFKSPEGRRTRSASPPPESPSNKTAEDGNPDPAVNSAGSVEVPVQTSMEIGASDGSMSVHDSATADSSSGKNAETEGPSVEVPSPMPLPDAPAQGTPKTDEGSGHSTSPASGSISGPANLVPFPAMVGSSASTESSTLSQSDASQAPAQPLASPGTDPAVGTPQGAAATETGEAAGIKTAGPETGAPKILEDGTGLGVVRAFYEKLALSEADEERLFLKRGLSSKTSAALGFRSNPKLNQAFLEELLKMMKDGWLERDELLASGLFMRQPNSAELKLNKQFCGWGILGRKPKPQAPVDDDEFEQPAYDEWEWGWTQPVLVPYFNIQGELMGLRPHKGMGRRGTLAGTPRFYIPRAIANGDTLKGGQRTREEFRNVVITEGEFKAAALWQVVGAGRQDGRKPWGVAALPGISFARHPKIRQEVDAWLRKVRAVRVVIVFDNEEKGDPNLPGYKADFRKRYDSQIYARYLPMDVSHELQVKGEVGMIPNKWRDEKGKADWDGVLAKCIT
jgi:hypothetical protein